ncbi:MAG: choice-of-anchor Q domain-containing protein [Anaerolineales bacterium]|nr:choice-of-anchor Q domain-containing protein [Anaerolineales bacterium]
MTNCTQAGLQAALDAGGHINFSCGGGPVTIPLSSQLELSTSTSTVIDGGGLVTLDGQGITRIMHKGWHDPNSVGDITITLQNMRLINGKAPSGGGTGDHSGGAIASGYSGTRLHIIDSSFENNSTTDIHILDNQGGAIFSHNSHETIFSGVVFDGNRAGNGGAMGGISTGLLVFNSRFTDNHAQDDWSGGIVRGYGGAIHLDGVTNSGNPNSLKRVHVCGSEFEGNTSVRGGGALGVVVSDNKGTKATYEWSTFTNNEVFGLNGSYGQGGAIYHIEDDHAGANWEDNIEILNTTFHNNRAGRQGGGAWVYVLGHGLVENVTFEGNSTTAPFNTVGQGGAMVVTLGLIDINSTTFANNHAAYQAGALHAGGTGDPNKVVTLKNTIFLNNTLNEQLLPTTTEWQGYHTNRPMTDGGQNIQHPRLKPGWNNDVNNPITANPIYLDPLLLPLADNGGPTLTMALQFGSPAINNGAGGCPAIDQRGELRDPLCDIGPYEFLETSLMVAPAALAIEAGGVAQYEVSIQTSDPNPQPFDLTLTNSNPELQTSLQPSAIAAGETATLTVTDTHPTGPLIPGAWYSLPISADRPGEQLNGAVALLVGGYSVYLPLVDR